MTKRGAVMAEVAGSKLGGGKVINLAINTSKQNLQWSFVA